MVCLFLINRNNSSTYKFSVKAINAFVLGDAYKKRLEDKLGVIAVAVENVRKEANVRHQEVTQKISQRQDVYEYQSTNFFHLCELNDACSHLSRASGSRKDQRGI